jgi:hypothetical protein
LLQDWLQIVLVRFHYEWVSLAKSKFARKIALIPTLEIAASHMQSVY